MHTFTSVGYPKVRTQIQAISLAATDEVDEPRRRGVGGAERLRLEAAVGRKSLPSKYHLQHRFLSTELHILVSLDNQLMELS